MNLGGYSSSARDSSRSSDMANLSKGLLVTYQKTGYYPDPDNAFNITYSGGIVWTEGTVGTGTMNIINAGGGFRFSKKPSDPLITSKEYIYSKLAYGNGYQLKTDWEGDSVALYNAGTANFTNSNTFFFPEAQAAAGNPTLAFIKGNFS